MGAAWREGRDNKDFDRVIDMVKGVNEMGMEVCCTLGMLNADQAKRLAPADGHDPPPQPLHLPRGGAVALGPAGTRQPSPG